ncbi:MAG: glycosyltransferase family 2 protein [Bacteroidales bacterium]|nr:glycosyltransferase family 2 protein [Bacteroidales bacterium]
METFFWILLLLIVYSYLGYPVLLWLLNFFHKIFSSPSDRNKTTEYPEVTLFVAAYNESEFVHQKVNNSFTLDYPKEKISQVWVTDGSDDDTVEQLKHYSSEITLYHQPDRKGKTGAINRGMQFVKTPVVIFSDANSMLNREAIKIIIDEFKDPKVGCVAGEKRIEAGERNSAVHAGEGIYWKYESFIKTCESNMNSAMGAAGELFAIRTSLFTPIKKDTILDDFTISMQIAEKGYRIAYTPHAYAAEEASINIQEEFKRKIRIAYGGFQTLFRHLSLFNLFKHPLLTFQYFSHKVLRWLIIPFALPFVLAVNVFLLFYSSHPVYFIFILLQSVFYLLALLGLIFQNRNLRLTWIFAPYYLLMMNYSVILGFFRYLNKGQSVNWERAKRK